MDRLHDLRNDTPATNPMTVVPSSHHEFTLSSAGIKIWLASYDQVTPAQYAEYGPLLTATELEQEARFRFESDRCRYRVTRALLRTVLSRYYPLPPKDWQFLVGPYGRPEISHQAACAGISFNISHCAGIIALAVSTTRAVGIDVECLRERFSCLEIAEHYFAPEENKALQTLPASQQPLGFLEYWTLKESYIKARGMGLSLPLHRFSFNLSESGRIHFTTHPDLKDDAARWQFWQYRLSPEHVLAVCADRCDSCEAVLKMLRVVPLLREEDLLCELLRTS